MASSGYTFEQFVQAAAHAHPSNAFQQSVRPTPVMHLSPLAPAFNPRVPPPNIIPVQGHGQYDGGQPNFSFQFDTPARPPGNDCNMWVHQHPGFVQSDLQAVPDSVQVHEHPAMRGTPHQHQNFRSSRRGHGGHRGGSRGGHDQFRFQNPKRGFRSQQYVNSSGYRPRYPESHTNQRHSRNGYGDLLYSHADMSAAGSRNGESKHSEADSAQGQRNQHAYVRKVSHHANNREGGHSQDFVSSEEVSSHSTGKKVGGIKVNQRQRPASSGAARNRGGARSAPAGKKRAAHGTTATDQAEDRGDRRERMEEQLKRGQYECMVCCDNIRQEVAVWSCEKCYHVFHLRCIKQWVKSSLEDDIWRCPACQNSNTKPPAGYRCFCGKMKDPKFHPGEIPHSCGEVCGRKGKEGCSHRCTLLCHPGPCPPCNAVVHRACHCGAETKTMRCDQVTVLRCEKVCGKDLSCGQHECQVVCHKGECPPCQVTLVQECYGKHREREVLCGSEEAAVMSFSCHQACNKTLKCDNHVCEDTCHPGECGLCPLLPEQVTHCCCGQTLLSELEAAPRTSCLDPVPTCQKICNQPMACGPPDSPHMCQMKCHEGQCGQCNGVTTLTCVCGANQKDFPCRELEQFTDAEPFRCERRCHKKRMCGRHKCNEFCCTREVHICEIVCGRPLSCGLHKCEELCHRGNCRPCLQASFEELTCRCGAEVMYPPVPCGSSPPPCHRICTRQHDCDHPVRHTCHSEEVCPPCTELVHKSCMGDHEVRKNVACHMKDISCGRPCGKPLPCGQHKCIKLCHKGPCLSEEQNECCVQPCTKKRSDCQHACRAPCHTGPCPQTPCKAQMEIKCACGHRTSKVQCQAGSNLSAEIAQFQRLTVQAMASGAPGQEVDISQLTVQKKNTTRQLECDSSCALLERNRRLAQALQIQNPDLDGKLSGPKYSDFLKENARKQPAFVARLEKHFTDLVQNAKQSKQPSRSFPFPSMNRDQRRMVHELAEAYGCDTQSYDYEPNKNVVATAYRNKCFLPPVTLSASVSRSKAPPPIPHHTKPVPAWGTDKTATSLSKEKGKDKPDIDYFDFSAK